jgi:hypothetical protein
MRTCRNHKCKSVVHHDTGRMMHIASLEAFFLSTENKNEQNDVDYIKVRYTSGQKRYSPSAFATVELHNDFGRSHFY